jgi:hypothetical protein
MATATTNNGDKTMTNISKNQTRALSMMAERNIDRLYIDGLCWMDTKDVKTTDWKAQAVIQQLLYRS